MKKEIIAIIVVAGMAFMMLELNSCSPSESSKAPQWERYEVVESRSGTLQFRGIVEARQAIVVEIPESRELLKVLHGDGDYVSEGDLILQWDDSVLQTELTQKRQELAVVEKLLDAYLKVNIPRQRLQDIEKLHRIEKDINQAESALELETHLSGQNKGDKQRIEQTRMTLQRLHAMREDLNGLINDSENLKYTGPAGNYRLRILKLKSVIQELEARQAKSSMIASMTGIIQVLQPLQPGSMMPGPVLRIIDTQSLVVIGHVWQNEFLQLQPGQKVTIYPDFLDNEAFAGQIELKIPYGQKIKEISTGEEMSQFRIMVKLLTNTKDLLVGMTVMVVAEPQISGLQIPEDYIHQDVHGNYILKAGYSGRAEKIKVFPEPGYQGYYIVSGLKTGDVLLKPLPQKSDSKRN